MTDGPAPGIKSFNIDAIRKKQAARGEWMVKAFPIPAPSEAELLRFRAKLKRGADGCVLWTAGTMNGYGKFWLGGKDRLAHRVSWRIARGHLNPELVIDHLCRNRLCVNVAHLEEVTFRENLLRGDTGPGRNDRKTHCYKGHPFNVENTGYYPGRGGRKRRICRTCNRLKAAALRRRAKKAVS